MPRCCKRLSLQHRLANIATRCFWCTDAIVDQKFRNEQWRLLRVAARFHWHLQMIQGAHIPCLNDRTVKTQGYCLHCPRRRLAGNGHARTSHNAAGSLMHNMSSHELWRCQKYQEGGSQCLIGHRNRRAILRIPRWPRRPRIPRIFFAVPKHSRKEPQIDADGQIIA